MSNGNSGGLGVAPGVRPSEPRRDLASMRVSAQRGAASGDTESARFDVCVTLPMYNAESYLESTLASIIAFARTQPSWEFLFVDDGSRDHTREMLRRRLEALGVADQDLSARVRVVTHRANRGKGFAIRHAALASTAEHFLFTDGDLAYSPDQLPSLRDALNTSDVAIGCRAQPDGDFAAEPVRRVMGQVFNRLARMVIGLPLPDTQAGLKGFRRDAAQAIFARCRIADFAFDVEVLYLARRLGFRVKTIAARVSPVHASSGTSVRILRDPWIMLRSLISIPTVGFFGGYRLDRPVGAEARASVRMR
jgi:dolichyl-phosphate beta-glucosyltransferase